MLLPGLLMTAERFSRWIHRSVRWSSCSCRTVRFFANRMSEIKLSEDRGRGITISPIESIKVGDVVDRFLQWSAAGSFDGTHFTQTFDSHKSSHCDYY